MPFSARSRLPMAPSASGSITTLATARPSTNGSSSGEGLNHLAGRSQWPTGAAAPGRPRWRGRRPAHPRLRAELSPGASRRDALWRRTHLALQLRFSIDGPQAAGARIPRAGPLHPLGTQPEVSGAVARRDVALVYALFESDRAGRPVTIEEVESGAVDAYQREIDAHLGLLEPAVAGV